MKLKLVSQSTRIQIALGHILIAEAIVESPAEASKLWSKYATLKYRRGLEIGGAVVQRANLPRSWNVPVGTEIK